MLVRRIVSVLLLAALAVSPQLLSTAQAEDGKDEVRKFVRFQVGETVAYGLLENDRVRRLSGDLFGDWKKTDTTYALDEVKLLVPSEPTQVFALAGNYRSHLGEEEGVTTTITTVTTVTTNPETQQSESESETTVETRAAGEIPEQLQIPQPFYKSVSSLQRHGGNIVIPKGSTEVHYEAELVIVIGKRARNVSKEEAPDYVLGVTCGNDVSARVWQQNDVQWWRAKGSDTFGPCGPVIASGLDYDNLNFELRLNGEVRQKDNTKHMIHDVASTVSFISRHVTLHPGDLIFTGTTGQTSAIQPGDVVEVEFEGVGMLRNSVVAEE